MIPRTISTVAVCATLLWTGAALATSTPGQICAAAKQQAAGQKTKSKLTCYAKYTRSGGSFDLATCLVKAEATFAKAFHTAEFTTRGEPRGCATTGDAAAVEALVDDFVAAVVEALPAVLATPTPTFTNPPSTPIATPTNPPSCSDGIKNGNETDVDCGGGTCPACAVANACASDSDCTTNACDTVSLTCATNQCVDHQKDGVETDVDCGGGVCPSCTVGKTCNNSFDCQTGHTCSTSIPHVCQ